jgi:large repetitive protein
VTTVAALESLAGSISIADACTPDAALTVTSNNVVNGTCPIVLRRTYTVTDACGNSATIIQIININDTQAPVVSGVLTPVSIEGCNAAAAPAPVTTVAALEALPGSISISDICTSDALLTVTSISTSAGTCPIIINRRYTVTDACGNSVSIVQIINVDDNTSPVIAGSLTALNVSGCNASAAPAPVTTVAALEALPGGMTITDACTPDAALTVSSSEVSAGTCPLVITRTYTVTDACGNSSTVVHVINVNDNTAPVVTGVLTPALVEGCGIGAAPLAVSSVAALEALPGGITITDACTPDVGLLVSSSSVISGTCPIVITRTYTVTDACGNSVNIIHILNVDDTTPPAVTGTPTSLTIEGCNVSAAPAAASSVAGLETLPGITSIADVCTTDANITVTHTDVPSGTCPIVLVRTYTLRDVCGNTVNIVHTINIDDNTLPVITGALAPLNIEGCTASDAIPMNTVAALEAKGLAISDNCTADAALVVTSSDVTAGTCPIVVTRTYRVTDACGNSATVNQVINVDDNTNPVVAGALTPIDIEGCNAASAPVAVTTVAALEALPGGVTITDACTPDASLVVTSIDVASGSCPIVITRTYTVRDICNNSVNIVQIINVDDNTAPVIAGVLAPTLVEGCAPGNAPPAVTTVAALEALTGGITVTDGCTPDAGLTVTSSDVSAGTCPIVLTRTYTVKDVCGNSATVVHIFNIGDNTPPVVTGTIPASTIAGCSPADAIPVNTVAQLEALGVAIADVCTPDAALVVTSSDAVAGTCPAVVTRTYTIADGCDNRATVTQVITVSDLIAPVITGTITPSSIEGCDALSAPAAAASVAELESLVGGVAVSDNCTPDGLMTVSHTDVSTGTCPLILTRTYTVKDACNNSATIIHTITIDDTTPPAVAGSIAPLTADGCSVADAPAAVTTVADLEALAGGISVNDVCTPKASLSVAYTDNASGSCPLVITRIYTISDACLNSVDITQIITLEDNTAPVIAGCPSDITVGNDAGICGASVPWTVPVITDNCSSPIVVSSHNPGDIFPAGTTPVTITATDNCGNTVSCSFNVTVTDTELPAVTCPANIFRIEDVGFAHASVNIPVAATADNCSVSLLTWSMTGVTTDASPLAGINQIGTYIFNTGVTNVTYVVADPAGNTATCTFTVTIAPPLSLSGSVTSQTNVACFGNTTGSVTVSGSDGYPPYEYSLNGGTYQASGIFGSLAAGSYTVTVRDASLGTFDVAVTITQPLAALAGSVASQTNVLCFNNNTGSVTVAATDGTSPYLYSLNGAAFQASGIFSALTAGSYSVTIQDANSCIFVVPVTITQPLSALSASITSQTNVSCSGGSNGSVTAGGAGGTAPYEYSINGGAYQPSGTFNALAAATFTITVRDANLCTANASVTLTEPAPLALSSTVTDASCPGEPNGAISLTITGGTQPYTVIWADGASGADRVSIPDGTYSVVVTDSKGCAASLVITVGVSGTSECVVVPTIITPNSDGYNDEWQIKNISIFPDAEVQVFNRWGERVFSAKNPAANPWDGTYKGKLLPMDSYHYILYLNDGSEPKSGTITIMR